MVGKTKVIDVVIIGFVSIAFVTYFIVYSNQPTLPDSQIESKFSPAIEQNTFRRITRTGLIAHHPDKAEPGFVLYSALNSGNVYLVNNGGETVHTWQLPYKGGYGYLLPNGNLFFNGQFIQQGVELPVMWEVMGGGGIMQEVDWEGNVVWEHRDPYHHHDGRRVPGGGAIYLSLEQLSEEEAARVVGGMPTPTRLPPGMPGTPGLWADVIMEVDAEGKTVWEWHAKDHLQFEEHPLPPVPRILWSQGNAVEQLDEDRLLVSFRNISTVVIINKAAGKIEWQAGKEMFAQQHTPTLLANGNLLVFDNGQYREGVLLPFSRVLEIDVQNKRPVWEYRDMPMWNFYSPHISSAQRLENGNTLIVEGVSGRVFQVTAERELVWEYINPHFVKSPTHESNEVYRAYHYRCEAIPRLAGTVHCPQ